MIKQTNINMDKNNINIGNYLQLLIKTIFYIDKNNKILVKTILILMKEKQQ